MSEKYKASVNGELYFVTVTVIDWVDLLTRPDYKNVIIEGLMYCQENKSLSVHAFVIMSNHWHAILSSNENSLSDIMRDVKKHTSKKLIELINETNESRKVWMLKKFAFAANRINRGVNFKVWQEGFHPIHLSSAKMVEQRLEYVHMNPVVGGIVKEPEHYVYSSASNYVGDAGLMALQMLD